MSIKTKILGLLGLTRQKAYVYNNVNGDITIDLNKSNQIKLNLTGDVTNVTFIPLYSNTDFATHTLIIEQNDIMPYTIDWVGCGAYTLEGSTDYDIDPALESLTFVYIHSVGRGFLQDLTLSFQKRGTVL